jgi:Late exocytosis, associated with Golgi transport
MAMPFQRELSLAEQWRDADFSPLAKDADVDWFHTSNSSLLAHERRLQNNSPSTAPTVAISTSLPTSLSPTLQPTTDRERVLRNDSTIVKETLRFYGSLYLISFIVFCFARRRWVKYFAVRSWSPEIKTQLAVDQLEKNGVISWSWQVLSVSDEEFFEHCGFDALCFVRILRMGRQLALAGCFHAFWLIPLYKTAEASTETKFVTDTWEKISISNLPSSSKRFIGTVVASYLLFFYTMLLILRELRWYTAWRHRFLAQPTPRNYGAYIFPELGLQ